MRHSVLLIIVSLCSAPAFGQGFRFSFTIGDGFSSRDLVIGVDAAGTDGEDEFLDVEAPPTPPVPDLFDARLSISGKDYVEDIRDNSVTEKVFTVGFQAGVGAGPIVITWDPSLLAGLGSFTIEGIDMTGTNVFDTGSGNGTVEIRVTPSPPPNNAPLAVDDFAVTDEDTPTTVNVAANDVDVDGDVLGLSIVMNPTNGAADVIEGQIRYTPAVDYNGLDAFTYQVSDGRGGTGQAVVNLTVQPTPDDPVQANPFADLTRDIGQGPLDVSLIGRFNDPDGDILTFSAESNNASVVATAVSGDVLTLTPNGAGTATITVTATDPTSRSASATFDVTVDAPNRAPSAGEDAATTDEDVAVTINVLDNDSDPDGDALGLSIISNPSHGNAEIVSGQIRYTPAADYNGSDALTYQINDGNGGTAQATVNVTVRPVNDPPTANPDQAETTKGVSVTIGVLANDSDIDGDVLSIVSVSSTASVINSSGTVTYTPPPGFSGTDVFRYTISDGNGGTDEGVVTINVAKDQDRLDDAVEDAAPNNGDGNNDGIPDRDQEHVASLPNRADSRYVTLAAPAGVRLRDVGAIDNPAPADAPAGATFPIGFLRFGLEGIQSGSATTVTIHIDSDVVVNTYLKFGPTSDNPIPHWYSFPYDGTTGAEILGDRIVLHFVDGLRGDSDLQADGVIDDPGAPGFVANRAPTAADDAAETREDEPVTIDVLGNDGDPENDPLRLEIVAQPRHGSVTVDEAGTPDDPRDDRLLYAPDENYHGLDTLYYRIHDGEGGNAVASVVLTVIPVNDLPVAVDDAFTVPADIDVLLDVLANDSDVDGDELHVVETTDPTSGSVQLLTDGRISYRSADRFGGVDSISYTISDGNGGVAQASVALTISSSNRAPIARDDDMTTAEDSPIALTVLINDDDPDGEAPELTIVADPQHGTAEVRHNNTPEDRSDDFIENTPDADFFGEDSLVYKLQDAEGLVATATVYITVAAVNDPPSPVAIVSPADGTLVELFGDPGAPFVVTWETGRDAEGSPITYRWQLAQSVDFNSLLLDVNAAAGTRFETTNGALGAVLTDHGVETGATVDAYHRVITSDGETTSVGQTAGLSLFRGVLTSTDGQAQLPGDYVLKANYPNPFNPSTTIAFGLPEPEHVVLRVFDILGHEVAVLLDRQHPAGWHTVTWEAGKHGSGVYFYRIDAGSYHATRHMLLLK